MSEPTGIKGVIELLTGDLLRFGYGTVFDYDPLLEALRDDVPEGGIRRDQPGETKYSRWTGDEWIFVDVTL